MQHQPATWNRDSNLKNTQQIVRKKNIPSAYPRDLITERQMMSKGWISSPPERMVFRFHYILSFGEPGSLEIYNLSSDRCCERAINVWKQIQSSILQGGSLLVINGVIAPIIRHLYPQLPIYKAICRAYDSIYK